MEALIARYGLLAVFVGAALEGDVAAIMSGVVAHLSLLHFSTVLVVGWLGAVAADCAWYAIGRSRATWARKTQTYQSVGPRIDALVGRLGAGEVLIARFIFGTRVVSMLYWGIRGLPFARFAALDLIGCAIWVTALTTIGYVFSGSAVALVGNVKRAEVWLLVAFIVAAVAAVLARRLLRRSLVQVNVEP